MKVLIVPFQWFKEEITSNIESISRNELVSHHKLIETRDDTYRFNLDVMMMLISDSVSAMPTFTVSLIHEDLKLNVTENALQMLQINV